MFPTVLTTNQVDFIGRLLKPQGQGWLDGAHISSAAISDLVDNKLVTRANTGFQLTPDGRTVAGLYFSK